MRIVTIGLFATVFLACSTQHVGNTQSTWVVKSIDLNALEKVEIDSIAQVLIADLQTDYQKNPSVKSYDLIKLSSAFLDKATNHNILIFDIAHVDDVQVIYEVDSSGQVVSKYLRSIWENQK
jgi:hypothetical protein